MIRRLACRLNLRNAGLVAFRAMSTNSKLPTVQFPNGRPWLRAPRPSEPRRGLCADVDRDFNPQIARQLVDEQEALVLDVRSEMEFQRGALEEAELIPYAELLERTDELEEFTKGNKEKPIVVYCQSGTRSNVAKQILGQLGYTNVVNLGGIAEAAEYQSLAKPP